MSKALQMKVITVTRENTGYRGKGGVIPER